MNKLTVFTRHR